MRLLYKQTIAVSILSAIIGILLGFGAKFSGSQLTGFFESYGLGNLILFGILILTATGGLTFLAVGGINPSSR